MSNDKLYSVCGWCHYDLEFDGDSKKAGKHVVRFTAWIPLLEPFKIKPFIRDVPLVEPKPQRARRYWDPVAMKFKPRKKPKKRTA